MIEKGVLHLDQNEFSGRELKKERKKEGKRKKKKGKWEERRFSFY